MGSSYGSPCATGGTEKTFYAVKADVTDNRVLGCAEESQWQFFDFVHADFVVAAVRGPGGECACVRRTETSNETPCYLKLAVERADGWPRKLVGDDSVV